MTKSLRGSSLPQARSYHHHYHNRQHHERAAAAPENDHHHQHRRQLHETDPNPTTTTSASASASSAVAPHRVVVQTVSLIEVVDAAGVPLEVLTRYATPATVDVESLSPSAGFSLSVDATLSASSTSYPSSESSNFSNETPPSTAASTTASSTEASSAWNDVSVTSQPLISLLPSSAAPTPFPSLSASVNSTIPFLSSVNSSVLTATSASSWLSPNTTSATSSLLSSLSSSFASDSSSLSTSKTFATSTSSSTVAAEATDSGNGDGGAGVGGGGLPAPTSTSTGNVSGNDKSTPSTGTVVGSVVGSIAGVAFLALLAFLVLRWKKRCGGRLRLSDHTARGQRGILTGSGAPDGGNSSGMAQRSLTFGSAAVAGAAAASRPLSRRASEPLETGERSFVKVAGRKLPSVLQAGGDGFTDPRAGTANDDESVYYRDSQAFFNPSAPTRLAVGTPMRPISGVPVIQPSPARTPVTESAPFPDPTDMTQFPLKPPVRDPIGRTSPAGSRGSRGSASRFTEDM